MNLDLEVLKSCRICRTNGQDQTFESLLVLKEDQIYLSEHGKLYEELFALNIDLTAIEFYPQFLCSSCGFQMKLFGQLKIKAVEAHKSLKKKFDSIYKGIPLKSTNLSVCQVIGNEKQSNNMLHFQDKSINDLKEERFCLKVNANNQNNEKDLLEIYEFATEEPFPKSDSLKRRNNINDIKTLTKIESGVEMIPDFIKIDDNDTIDNVELSKEYTDVQYLDDFEDSNSVFEATSNKKTIKCKRNFRCVVCDTEFKKRVEFVKHRKTIHNNMYPCSDCNRILKTSKALVQHRKIHMGVSPFKCELCTKFFNQKVHYQYHMDKHNNIRKFKCEFCSKSYLSRADLNVHIRIHTNDRRYICDICGKDFLLFQHLKMHSYRHIGKKFECHICHQMLISPCTLQTHIKTMHTTIAKYKCNLCDKLFHKKCYFDAHFKTHEHDKPIFEIIPTEQLYKDESWDQLIECVEDDYAAEFHI